MTIQPSDLQSSDQSVDSTSTHLTEAELSAAGVRAELAEFISQHAVVRGKVTLSNGQESDYYVDLRRVTLSSTGAPLVGQAMLAATAELSYDAVGGLTLGADPVAFAMMHQARLTGQSLDSFVVRKTQKTHGLQRQVEGPEIVGRDVLIVEDTSTTGNSALTAAHAARANGANVVAIAVIVDRNSGSRQAIESAGFRYVPALTIDDISI